MEIQELTDKKIAVLGYGMEGKAVTAWLLKRGITPVIFDRTPYESWPAEDQDFCVSNAIQTITGPDVLKELVGFDVAFRSPGIWRLHPDLKNAELHGLRITSQTQWFLQHTKATVVGITGTKGKGTTTSLIYNIVFDAIKTGQITGDSFLTASSRVFITGNIGEVQPMELPDDLTAADVVVYELSSFQLQDITNSPKFAVVLMITQDHLDHHANLEEYYAAKQNIVRFQEASDVAVINIDYEASAAFQKLTPATIYAISQKQEVEQGCSITAEGEIMIKGFDGVQANIPFVTQKQILLRGFHNLQNIAAATAVTGAMGIAPESIHNSILAFKGLEHRLEFVGTISDVSFYNDSFSTVPDTTIAAINSFSEKLIVILGGSDKRSDFTELAKIILDRSNVKALILIGETAPQIQKAIEAQGNFQGKIFTGAHSMGDIFNQVTEISEPGDVVLLSPGCASFGMFKNYKERGQQFKEYAKSF
jgi:UDP-N-acetylmuramoylalanine--D-glutamate ligase